MNIGNAVSATGLPAKTIRYYEEIELVVPRRTDNGYRDYTEQDLHRLAFVQRARSLGFTIAECRQLLSLYDDKRRASAQVKALTMDKIEEIDQKIASLRSLKATLKSLADNCHGDNRPDCPILKEMAGGPSR